VFFFFFLKVQREALHKINAHSNIIQQQNINMIPFRTILNGKKKNFSKSILRDET